MFEKPLTNRENETPVFEWMHTQVLFVEHTAAQAIMYPLLSLTFRFIKAKSRIFFFINDRETF